MGGSPSPPSSPNMFDLFLNHVLLTASFYDMYRYLVSVLHCMFYTQATCLGKRKHAIRTLPREIVGYTFTSIELVAQASGWYENISEVIFGT